MEQVKITPAMQKQIEKQMAILKCDYDEALEIVLDDLAIDKGERMDFDLSPEEEKKAKKYANVDTHKQKKTVKREPKPNELKEAIVAEVAKFLAESGTNGYENVVISNKSRQISFKIGEKSFDFTLVEHRPPKK